MKSLILALPLFVSQLAFSECKLPENFAPKDVDVLAEQVVATLQMAKNVTVCTCDEKGMSALMTEVEGRKNINKKNVYTSPELGFCTELKTE